VEANFAGGLASNLNQQLIDKYNVITTCDAMNLDKIKLLRNNVTTDSVYMSFDIYKRYSILAFDTDKGKASTIVAIPPIDDRMNKRTDKAIVRVVNGNYTESGITVSFGARTAEITRENNTGYESGITIAVNLESGEYSKEMYINGGKSLPIAVFATTQPTKYLFSAIIEIENGKEYIIAVDKFGNGKITAIEIDDEQKAIQYAEPASYFQFINVSSGNINFSLPNIIQNGTLARFTPSLASFVPLGNNSIQAAGNNFDFTTNLTNRTLLIATGSSSQPELFAIQSPSMGANYNAFK
jgi:hypothetical protein